MLLVFTYLPEPAPETVAPEVSVKSNAAKSSTPEVKVSVPVEDITMPVALLTVTPPALFIVRFFILVLIPEPIAVPVLVAPELKV